MDVNNHVVAFCSGVIVRCLCVELIQIKVFIQWRP